MTDRKRPEDCSGCSACYAICPVSAISMVPDKEGFLYPKIDESKCTKCGLCERVCPFHTQYARADGAGNVQEYYALVHTDPDTRAASRSGGAFAAMAQVILDRGGSVYGAALDEALQVYTKGITNGADIAQLQGSKYVQSDKRDSFRLVREDLNAGKYVLFSGTGCEVSGLISYLRHSRTDMERLYTCDIVCHGVPSPLVWKENVAQIEKRLGGKPQHVSFRDKRFGWRAHIESYNRGSKTLYANRYSALFCSGLTLRRSCSSCHFCNYDRCGDVTVADFWGCEKLELPADTAQGVSLLMIHSPKGKTLLDAMYGTVQVFPVRKEQTSQPNLHASTASAPKRAAFWADYCKYGYSHAAGRYYDLPQRLRLPYNLIRRRKRL